MENYRVLSVVYRFLRPGSYFHARDTNCRKRSEPKAHTGQFFMQLQQKHIVELAQKTIYYVLVHTETKISDK